MTDTWSTIVANGTPAEAAICPGRSSAIHPDSLLTRDATAAALTAAGYPVRSKTLSTKASRGGGPKFRKFGTRPLYRWADALEWATGRLGPTVSSTSELQQTQPPTAQRKGTMPERRRLRIED